MKRILYLLVCIWTQTTMGVFAQEIQFSKFATDCPTSNTVSGIDKLGKLKISELGDKKILLHNKNNNLKEQWLQPEIVDGEVVIDLSIPETRVKLGIDGNLNSYDVVIEDKDDSENKCLITYKIESSSSSTATEQEYVKDKLYPKLGLTWNDYQVARKKDTTYIFLNSALRVIDKTEVPGCSRENSYYRVFVVMKKDEGERATFEVGEGESSGFGIESGNGSGLTVAISAKPGEKEYPFKNFKSDVYGPFSSNVKFNVTLYKKDSEQQVVFDRDNAFTIQGCNQPIHVSILAGFYYSTLNDPTNIASGQLPSGEATLFADNSKSQRALTIMALFYPKPRLRDYNHKNLTFMQKWGVAFGTKISQDLFSDLLLGVNYEFAKGGSFTTGLHYGKHTEIRGYDNFQFGKSVYAGAFSNDQTTQQWNFGWFIGVTIDLRVVTAIRGAAKRESDSNTTSRQP